MDTIRLHRRQPVSTCIPTQRAEGPTSWYAGCRQQRSRLCTCQGHLLFWPTQRKKSTNLEAARGALNVDDSLFAEAFAHHPTELGIPSQQRGQHVQRTLDDVGRSGEPPNNSHNPHLATHCQSLMPQHLRRLEFFSQSFGVQGLLFRLIDVEFLRAVDGDLLGGNSILGHELVCKNR